jgi:hypothetical protein
LSFWQRYGYSVPDGVESVSGYQALGERRPRVCVSDVHVRNEHRWYLGAELLDGNNHVDDEADYDYVDDEADYDYDDDKADDHDHDDDEADHDHDKTDDNNYHNGDDEGNDDYNKAGSNTNTRTSRHLSDQGRLTVRTNSTVVGRWCMQQPQYVRFQRLQRRGGHQLLGARLREAEHCRSRVQLRLQLREHSEQPTVGTRLHGRLRAGFQQQQRRLVEINVSGLLCDGPFRGQANIGFHQGLPHVAHHLG